MPATTSSWQTITIMHPPVVLDRVKQITGKDFRFYQADMTKHEDVEKIFAECPDITAVIQFAAYKAVGESVSKPIEYSLQ